MLLFNIVEPVVVTCSAYVLEISILRNSSHFEWRVGLLATILKMDLPNLVEFGSVGPEK
jgi:hypothetical protein